MRLDLYYFEINLPKTAYQFSVDITPKTEEGFASNGGNYKGFNVVGNMSTASGYKITYSFYIQRGAAYNILGQQLCANTEVPLPGKDVRYNYTYMIKVDDWFQK